MPFGIDSAVIAAYFIGIYKLWFHFLPLAGGNVPMER
jgi:hypothetical protein